MFDSAHADNPKEKRADKQQVKILKRQTVENLGTQRIYKKKIPKREHVECPLTEDHRNEINYLVRSWAELSQKAKSKRHHIAYGQAYCNLWDYGLDGAVNGIEQIEESEYQRCKVYLNQKIMIATRRAIKDGLVDSSEIKNRLIGSIKSRYKNLNFSDEQQEVYHRYRFKKDSLSDFLLDELQELYNFVMSKNPKFIIPKEDVQLMQKDREQALLMLLGDLEQQAKKEGHIFDLKRFTYRTKEEMFRLLEERQPHLFGCSHGQLLTFWSKQKICKCVSGARPKKPTTQPKKPTTR